MMIHTRLLLNTLPSLMVIFLVFLSSCQVEKDSATPNIVVVFTDDQGYEDLGCYGSPDIKTPNIDKLAKNGTRFTNFHVAQAVCSASRAALLTGCYSNRVNIHGALMPDTKHGLHPEEETIADMLKKVGYKTAIFGKWHLGASINLLPTRQGFDEYFGFPYSNDMSPVPENNPRSDAKRYPPIPLYENETVLETEPDQSNLTTWYTEKAVDFINRNKDNPFFLYVPHSMPHVPLYVSDKFKGKSERGLYGDVIMEIDWSVGQIMETLDKNGLTDNTLVIYTSDNGPWLIFGDHSGEAHPLREGKGSSWEGGVRVPTVMHWPGNIPADKVCKTPLMTIDILPTIANVTGAPLPERKIDGMNVWPVISGQEGAENPHEAYFIYYHTNQLQAMISGDWKMIFPHRYRTPIGGIVKDGGMPGKYNYVNVEEPELYNLVEDIGESRNVIAENSGIAEEMMVMADSMRLELGDKLLDIEGKGNREPGWVEE